MQSPHRGPWPDWLGRFRAILLDMHGTFMFDHDRFLPDVDYSSAYAAEGGARLHRAEVNQAIRSFLARYAPLYSDLAWQDRFPPVERLLRDLHPDLPDAELIKLEAVIAAHELGRIPKAHAEAIRRLARTHRLGVVSNLWSHARPWREALAREGLDAIFEVTVFSSDHGCVKPSPRLFGLALARLGLPAAEVLFVGDDLLRDVAGAKRAGMSAAWIGNWPPAGTPPAWPDGVIPTPTDQNPWVQSRMPMDMMRQG